MCQFEIMLRSVAIQPEYTYRSIDFFFVLSSIVPVTIDQPAFGQVVYVETEINATLSDKSSEKHIFNPRPPNQTRSNQTTWDLCANTLKFNNALCQYYYKRNRLNQAKKKKKLSHRKKFSTDKSDKKFDDDIFFLASQKTHH